MLPDSLHDALGVRTIDHLKELWSLWPVEAGEKPGGSNSLKTCYVLRGHQIGLEFPVQVIHQTTRNHWLDIASLDWIGKSAPDTLLINRNGSLTSLQMCHKHTQTHFQYIIRFKIFSILVLFLVGTHFSTNTKSPDNRPLELCTWLRLASFHCRLATTTGSFLEIRWV